MCFLWQSISSNLLEEYPILLIDYFISYYCVLRGYAYIYANICCLIAKLCLNLVTPCTIAHQAPLSKGFPKQEYWSELLFPSPGNLSDPGIASGSPALSGGFFTLNHLGSPIYTHLHIYNLNLSTGTSQVVLVVKNPAANAGNIRDTSSIPGLGRSSGGGHGNPLQYSCLENPTDRGVWQVTVYGLARVRHNWSDLAHTSVYTVFCLWDHIKYVLSAVFFFFSIYDFAFSYQCFWR